MDRKVFVIGLDGATFNVIEPLVKAGKLPNISRMMKQGTYALLKSTIPPLTPVAWPSLFTGKLSGKHGIFDFSLPTKKFDEKKRQLEKKRANSSFIKSKALWELLSEQGKKCIVVDVPMTYPPNKINGIMISRVMATNKTRVTYPKGLYFNLIRKRLLFSRDKGPDPLKEHQKLDEKEKMRRTRRINFGRLLKDIDRKVELISHLNSNYAWDFFMAVFMESDQVGHGFWKERKKVELVYKRLDKAIGRIFSFLPQDSLKVIVSDHGFKDIKGQFFLNEWFSRRGYASRSFEPDKKSVKLLEKLHRFKEDFHKKPAQPKAKFRFEQTVDTAKSLAYLYSGTSYGIRINLKGRDPKGLVKEQDYPGLRDKLIKELKGIKAPGNSRALFEEVLKKEEVIGSTDDDYGACDIYFLPKDMDFVVSGFERTGKVLKLKRSGFHRREGVFFACGSDFKKGFNAGELSIIDVTPTIMHIMNLAVPQDMDGKVRKETFSVDSDIYDREARLGKESRKQAEGKRLSDKEETKLKARLRALGYIE